MKLSLNWIFDHIQSTWQRHDVPELIKSFNAHVLEIEHIEYISVDLSLFAVGSIKALHPDALSVFIPEFNQEVTLPLRSDAFPGNLFLLCKHDNEWHWAQGQDFKSAKEGFIPRLSMHDDQVKGSWKDAFQSEDYRLTIDNIAISHRPDLWGHRGFAREIAALINTPMIPLYDLTATIPVKEFDHEASKTPEAPFSLKIDDRQGCRRLAGMYISHTEPEGSWLDMAYRLLLVDARPLNALVDTTNYVMFDLSQPLHAFDANKLSVKQLVAKKARKGESLLLLDDQKIELTGDDLIISDGKKPLALAGIMGGKECSVSDTTDSLLIEAASFDPSIIRKSSTYFKTRSEASTRFEKDLDPNQNVTALLRFVHILSQRARLFEMPKAILSVGHPAKPRIIEVTHEYLEKKLGVSLEPSFIDESLTKLDFGVECINDECIKDERIKDAPKTYRIIIPTFRGTKDVVAKEDIAEEVGRCFGFGAIPHKVPALTLKPHSLTPLFRLDRIRHYLAFAATMHEVKSYPLYDNEWLVKIGYEPKGAARVINPVAQHMEKLVTSLVPGLLKNINQNSAHIDWVNFFEYNTIWHKEGKVLDEKQSLAGIFYHEKSPIDFYDKKCVLFNLFAELNFEVSLEKPDKKNLAPWYHPHKTMALVMNKQCIGFAGNAHPAFLHRAVLGDAFIFELDADALLSVPDTTHTFTPLSKFEHTWADISMLVPVTLTYQILKEAIEKLDDRIFSVSLIDYFQKPEWHDQRSLAIRYFARAQDHTLTGQEIEELHDKVVSHLDKQFGVQIR